MKNKIFALLVATLSIHASAALASDVTETGNTEEFANSSTVADVELDKNRGTFLPFMYNYVDMTSNVTGNSCIGCTSGDNNIGSGALNGFNGFATVIQNSGANVSIQTSTAINVLYGTNP